MRVREPIDALLWILPVALGLIISCDRATDSVERVGDLAGVVRSVENHEIIVGAIVECDGVIDTSDANGNFFLTNLSAGYNTLSASKQGYEPYLQGITIKYHTDFDILMETRIFTDGLKGHVFLSGSAVPVADVLIRCGSRSVISAADGSYKIDSLRAGQYALNAIKQHYVTKEIILDPDTISQLDIMMPSTSIAGQVYNRIDGPVSDAQIEIAGMSGVTDNDGRFVIPIVPQGNHETLVIHSRYDPETTWVKIELNTAELAFVLKRFIYDSIDVVNDANIVYTDFDGCPDCPVWWDYHQGDNHDDRLRLEYYSTEADDGRFFMGFTRALVQLPPLPEYLTPFDIDSAWLCLRPTGESYLPGAAAARRAVAGENPWTETLVAWSTAPEVSPLVLGGIDEFPDDVWTINVRTIYRDPRDLIRTVRLQKEEIGLTPVKEYLNFWSSEAPEVSDRPFVILKYYY